MKFFGGEQRLCAGDSQNARGSFHIVIQPAKRQGRIHGNRHDSRADRAEERENEMFRGVQNECKPIPFRQAEGLKTGTDSFCLAANLRKRPVRGREVVVQERIAFMLYMRGRFAHGIQRFFHILLVLSGRFASQILLQDLAEFPAGQAYHSLNCL